MITSFEKQYNNSDKKSLKSIVYREFLRKALIPILFVEVALIVFYFVSISYMTEKTVDVMSQSAKQNLLNLSDIETRYINNKLNYISEKTYEFKKKYDASMGLSLDGYVDDVLPTDLPWNSGALILDEQGNVLVMSKALHELIGKGIEGSEYVQIVPPYTQNDFSKGTSFIDVAMQEFMTSNHLSKEFQLLDERYFVTQSVLKETGWRLVILTHMKSIYAPIYEQKSKSQNLGFLVILLIVNFYVAFFIYLMIASKKFANRITQPIEKISRFISRINQQKQVDTPVSYVKIRELDDLIDLNVEIQEAKQKYLKINTEMHFKNEQLERLAVTDPLTQCYNRLKLDQVLRYEVARTKRDKTPLSLILLDIDYFKKVNDTYGHQAGDSVLVEMTQALLKNIRRTDILGRWGGEEFLLILPNTDLKSAAVQAEKLRYLVSCTEFEEVDDITISLGVSSCCDKCTEHSLLEAADKALYSAKEAGRNCVKKQRPIMPMKLKLVRLLDQRAQIKYSDTSMS